MKQFFTFLLLMLFSLFCHGSKLPNHLEELKKQLKVVEGDKVTFEQQLNYDPAVPYRLEILLKETDKKGRITERRRVLNLGMMNKNLVRRENSRDLMWVSVKTGGLPVIKVYENGELDDYEEELQLYAQNVDNARAIEDIIRAAIPLAETAWKQSVALPSNLPALRQWITEHVKEVDAGKETFKQWAEEDPEHPARVLLVRETYDEKGLEQTERISWNCGDLHEPSVRLRIRGKEMMIEADTREKQKFISVEKDGELEGFKNSLVIYADDVDQAQLLIQVMRDLIPLARAASEGVLLQPSSLQEGMELIRSQLQEFSVNQEKCQQSLEESPVTVYARQLTNDKGRQEEKFIFDWSDLNEQSIAIATGRQFYEVEVATKESKSMIAVWEDGEQQNYDDQLSFYVAELPAAKQLSHLLQYVISSAKRELAPQNLGWLQTTLAGFDEGKAGLKQKLEQREEDNCKLSLTTLQEGGKKVDEHLIEFNLYDIDPDKLALEVKGKTVFVRLPTNFGEEIIKDYENGDKINYTDQFYFIVPDIEVGKTMVATLNKMVRDCSEK